MHNQDTDARVERDGTASGAVCSETSDVVGAAMVAPARTARSAPLGWAGGEESLTPPLNAISLAEEDEQGRTWGRNGSA